MTKEELEKEADDYADKHAFRVPYDGAEGWEYKSCPKKPLEQKSVKRIITAEIGWQTLAEMQDKE